MPSDRESPPYIQRVPCGPDTSECPILWRNLWAWFCGVRERVSVSAEIQREVRLWIDAVLSGPYRGQLGVQQRFPHQAAGVALNGAVRAGPAG